MSSTKPQDTPSKPQDARHAHLCPDCDLWLVDGACQSCDVPCDLCGDRVGEFGPISQVQAESGCWTSCLRCVNSRPVRLKRREHA